MMHNYQVQGSQQNDSQHLLPAPWAQQHQLVEAKMEPGEVYDSVQESGYDYSQQSHDHKLSNQQRNAVTERRRDPRLNLTSSHMSIHEVATVIAGAEPVPNEGAPPKEFWLVGNCLKNVKADVLSNIIYIPDALLNTLLLHLKTQLYQAVNAPLVIFCVGPLDLVPRWDIEGVKERLLEFMLRLAGLREELGPTVTNVALATIHPPSMKAGNHPHPAEAQEVINEVFRLYNVFVYYFNNCNNMRTLRLDKAFTCHKEVFTLRQTQLDSDGIQPGESCSAIMSGRVAKYIATVQQEWHMMNVSYASDSAGFEKNYTRVLKAEQKYQTGHELLNENLLPYPPSEEPRRKQMKLSSQHDTTQFYQPRKPARYPASADNSYNEPVPLLSLDVTPPAPLSHEAAPRSLPLSREATSRPLTLSREAAPRPLSREASSRLLPLSRDTTPHTSSMYEVLPEQRVDTPDVNYNVVAARRLVSRMPERLTPWIDRIYLQFLNTEKRIARIREDEDRIRLQDFEDELFRLHPL